MPIQPKRGVYFIPSGISFVDELAGGVISSLTPDPVGMADISILLPTRRACRTLTEAFLRIMDGNPALLPDMLPVGDIEDDGVALLDWEEPAVGRGADLPPAIPRLRRQLLLSNLIMKKNPSSSAAHAARLAAELARLIDEVQSERLDFSNLSEIVPDRFSTHWQETLVFLQIVTEHWPRVLAEQGFLDPVDRRNRLIERQIDSWEANPPIGPVIAAGSTGSVPATADLIACVAGLENGMVVLPGLDPTLDSESIDALAPSHPHYGLSRLLGRLGIAIGEVGCWGKCTSTKTKREGAINLALRPPATSGNGDLEVDTAEKFGGLCKVECPGPQQEALAIALMMRGALEDDSRTAALITPDRRLARRVAAELRRWNIEVDDSGGTPLAETLPGVFLRLTADAVASDGKPVPLLAALKHPLAAGGLNPATFRKRVRDLELAILRGPRPTPGFLGLRDALELSQPKSPLVPWANTLAEEVGPFSGLVSSGCVSAGQLLDAHISFAENLAASNLETGAERLWMGAAGEGAAEIINELRVAIDTLPPISGMDWPALLEVLMAGAVVRPKFGRHPRLNIWGLLEARLQQADLTILGGLNEGTWPPEPKTDPWMSRPMRVAFGLTPSERRIGLTAHDFVQAVSAPDVVVTRSTRVDGVPAVQARWLTRIENILSVSEPGRDVLEGWQKAEAKWIYWQAQTDSRRPLVQIGPPTPKPPVSVRPDHLSVTEIELLVRDPYAIYARRILGLRPIEPIDADPGAAERGSIIHRAIDRYLRLDVKADPVAALQNFLEIGKDEFSHWMARPGVRAFWWPRFERIARWIVEQEDNRKSKVTMRRSEVSGELRLAGRARPFLLRARADRIDTLVTGGYEIIDYKTGAVPTKKDVNTGLSPQLPLEGAMIVAGAFIGVPAGPAEALTYWRLSGGSPVGEVRAAGDDPANLAEISLSGLSELLDHYDQPETAYLARPDADIAPRYSDYDHLERMQEWAATRD